MNGAGKGYNKDGDCGIQRSARPWRHGCGRGGMIKQAQRTAVEGRPARIII